MNKKQNKWVPDFLGPDYQRLTISAPRKDGTPRQATLIHHCPPDASTVSDRPAVLYVHGWSDYFFNTELAEFFTHRGYDFYAIDLHNHGRNLGPADLGGYVEDLSDYFDELRSAHEIICTGAAKPLLLMGHSTGGLIAVLWAKANPELVSHLVLNSPWLELQGGAVLRVAATPLVRPLADMRPLARMRVPERSFYWRGISDEALGEWSVDRRMRPPRAFPVRAGWMRAILNAQTEVAAGLELAAPVLVLASTKSLLGPRWSPQMLKADVVLDVRALSLRALSLGDSVSVERVEGALHEVFLSPKTIRGEAYARLSRWLRGYVE